MSGVMLTGDGAPAALEWLAREDAYYDCPDCGHPALDHHGVDGRARRDAGCQTRTMRDDWCRCPHTATQAQCAADLSEIAAKGAVR